ncbi:MAG: glycosyltransferase, partial [Clostridia bacterium]|nr:glycosyltransferase [Clostridia bacterium]
MKNITVIIPAYKPDENLIITIHSIIEVGFNDIIVVDDGGGKDFDSIFDQVKEIPECTLLRHEVNKGKGAALKTAMRYFLDNRTEQIGVVTVDADGQHLAKDIKAVCVCMKEKGTIVLGCRDFSGDNVPARSKFGNKMTIGIVRLFFGMKVSDTQTGLRAFPKETIPEMLTVEGNRYEYETQMLFHMSKRSIPHNEVKIDTVYIENNSSSHFRVIHDSIRIYSLIIKYLISSIASTAVDAIVFCALKMIPLLEVFPCPVTFTASFIARAVSSLVNYLINAKAVFGDDVNRKTIARYIALVVAQISISAL